MTFNTLNRIITFLFLCSPLLSGCVNTTVTTNQTSLPTDIYLLIGQSNMAGRAQISPDSMGLMKNVYLLNVEDTWEPAKNPLNRYSTVRKHISMQRLGPGYSFAEAMQIASPDTAIGLVVNAKGGSSITEWGNGSYFYQEAVRRTNRAIALGGELKGVLWHQGETDAEESEYLDKLIELVGRLREDFSNPDLIFIAGQINDTPLVNAQIAQLPKRVRNTGFVSSEGLVAVDRWHFDAQSMKIMGQRYSEEMRRLQSSKE